MLKDIIPTAYRKLVYTIFAIVGVTIGATQVAFTAAQLDQPVWLNVALQVYLYVGVAFGMVASANTNVVPEYAGPDGYVPKRMDDNTDPALESVEAEPADTE